MNSFVCFALIAAAITLVASSPAGSSGVGSGVVGVNVNQEVENAEGQQQQSPIAIQSPVDLTRLRKAAGYGSSIPSPPCPKNYLFSCQPNLSPVPCSAPPPSYGSQGAYSAPVPTYVTPVRSNYGIPQTYSGSYLPQGLGYNNNQYYQY